MFRLVLFCDDKSLPRILHSVRGLVLKDGMSVEAVANAHEVNGTIKPLSRGSAADMMIAWMRKKKMAVINAEKAREFCREHNLSEGTYSSLLAAAQKVGALRKTGKGTQSQYTLAAKK